MVNADKLPLSFRLDVEDFTIGMSNCISFGLLTSEIISNAIKYAFTDIENPEILISFKLEGNNVEYAITDNGTGFDPEKIDKDKSLGIKLIDIFSRQLDASLRYEFLPGTRVSLSIPTNKLL
jgi:two-component sensor histidine kinase